MTHPHPAIYAAVRDRMLRTRDAAEHAPTAGDLDAELVNCLADSLGLAIGGLASDDDDLLCRANAALDRFHAAVVTAYRTSERRS